LKIEEEGWEYRSMTVGNNNVRGREWGKRKGGGQRKGFVINAHRKFSPRSINALRCCADYIIYGTLAEFTGVCIAKPCFYL